MLKLAIAKTLPFSIKLSGLAPGEFAELRIQDTSSGATAVVTAQADPNGVAPVNYPSWDNNKNVLVRLLTPGQDTLVHHLVYAPETEDAFELVDSDTTDTVVLKSPEVPVPVQVVPPPARVLPPEVPPTIIRSNIGERE